MRIRIVVRAIVRGTIVTSDIRFWESMYEVYLSQVGSLTKLSDKVIANETEIYYLGCYKVRASLAR